MHTMSRVRKHSLACLCVRWCCEVVLMSIASSQEAGLMVCVLSSLHADVPHENKVDRPALFPPTFLYTQSWEDPAPDMEVRHA